MKPRPFITLMIVLALLVVMTGYAVWETVIAPRLHITPEVQDHNSEAVEAAPVDLPDGISWTAPGIEVGTLYYTVTRASVLHSLNNTGIGGIRENAIVCIYDTAGNETMYYYPECADEMGNLVSGASFVVLDVTVTSQDAVNFITDPATGVQSRRYADNPFLFRADEIAYLVDIAQNPEDGYTFYDAVFFTEMGYFEEHDMAYELLPGDSISFRIGYLLGNRKDGTPLNHGDIVLTTNWGDAQMEFYDLKLS